MKTPGSGRKKGTPNKKTILADQMAKDLGVDPLEVLLLFTKGDWKALGYEAESTVCYTAAGIEYSKFTISPDNRIAAAKEAVKYLYSQKKAIELSADKDSGIKIILEDYTKKGK